MPSFSATQTESTDLVEEGPGWRLEVDPEGDGERLDRFIARRLPRVSRARASRLEVWRLDSRGVCEQKLKKSARVKGGSILWVRRPPPDEDLSFLVQPSIIDEHEDFLVIDKPPGWVAHPTASRYESAITTWLKKSGNSAQPAHRLDSETSGVLLCVRDPKLEPMVHRLFLEHNVEKHYLAITRVTPEGESRLQSGVRSWMEQRSLGFDKESKVGLKMGMGDLKSCTQCELLDQWYSPNFKEQRCLMRAKPLTGRQHQIRVHLSLAGFPLIGDKLYGPNEEYFLRALEGDLSEVDLDALGHDRQALHAERLILPWCGGQLEWHSPLPQDLHALLKA